MSTKLRVGISGEAGSFSQEAAAFYGEKHNLDNYELVYLTSVEKVLKSLKNGDIDMGIFPVENSNGGMVYEAIYAMSKYNFSVKNIFEIDVRHCLLTKTNNDQITTIYSHLQAIKQCRMYLKRTWPEAEIKEYSDTATAAKDLSVDKLNKNSAVIAPKKSAEIYNLQVKEENIQDLKFNFTTFLAVTN